MLRSKTDCEVLKSPRVSTHGLFYFKKMEKIEDLQFAGLRFIQNDTVFRFGTDAVLLASFAEAKKGEMVVDLGTGSGILPVLLSGRCAAKFIGIELQPAAAELAKRNIALNGLGDRARILQGDFRELAGTLAPVQVVVCNPPYDKLGSGGASQREAIRIARHEVACNLREVVQCAARLLQTGGRFYLIHRSMRMAEVIYEMKRAGLEPKVLRMVAPSAGAEPNYLLVKGVRGAAAGMRVLPQLNISEKGAYTRELREIYHMEG